jgi:hypothetical protein
MSASFQLLKLTPIDAVVKVYGVDSYTIGLATDLKLAAEVIGTPIVDIKAIWSTCQTATGNTIVRNGITLWSPNNVPFHFQFNGWSETQAHTSDIVVTLGASGGNIVLELRKKGGYGDEQQNLSI